MGSAFRVALFNILVLQVCGHCLFDNQPKLQSCGRRCLGVPGGGKVTCVSNCLVGKGVSWSCASCLGRGFNCGVNSCMGSCSTGFSKPSCTTCISSHCGLCSRARSSEGVADNATLEALVEVFAGAATAGTELEEEESSTRSGSGCFEVQALMKTCGTQCYSSSSQATCAAGCLTGKGVSPGCASCFGRKISCTIKTCLSGCAADPNGAACTSCVASKCGRCNAAKSLDEPVGKDNFVAALVELASQQQDQSEVDKTAELEEEESSTRSGSGCFEVQALMKTCGTQCYSSSSQATCAAGCLTGKGVSPGCASCFGRKISCTIKRCLSGCAADPNGAACTSCVASKCGRCNAAKSLDEPVGKDNFVAALVELASQQQDQSEVDKTAELEEEESSTRSGSGCFEVQALMKTCGTQCYSSSSQATCAAGCLTGKGVSPGCASCFGRKISCTIKTCLSGCAADPNGAACTSCVASKCGRCNAVKSLDEPVSKDNFVAALVELASQQQDENTILP